MTTHARVCVVDDIGRAQAPTQRRGQAEFADGEELVEPLAQASRRIRVLLVDPGGELLDPGVALLGAQLLCGPEHGECLVM